ncbi:MAG: glycoside hydrolase [Nitrosomonas sp.]|nr:glycoside hydrolase [Nitrosomonas sp.]
METNFNSSISKTHPYCKPNFITCIAVFLFGLIFFSGNTFAADGIKWHPGHYYQLVASAKTHPAYLMNNVYKDMANTPAILGVQVRYQWGDIEVGKGQYNFASIDKHLDEMAKRKKRLVIMIQTKSFGKSDTYVPSYLRSAEYDGGVFSYAHYNKKTFKGEQLKLWHPKVRERIAAFYKALGERYNAHPYFEGIGMSETALGDPLQPITSAQTNGFYEGLRQTLQAARDAFPNTMVMQSLNYPRPIIGPTVETLKQINGGLSSPDAFLQEPGLFFNGAGYPGIYTYYPKLSGIIALAPTVMHQNYRNTKMDGTGYEPTISEIHTFVRDKLKANYIFWTRDSLYNDKILEVLNSKAIKDKLPTGGLIDQCPSTYPACDRN